VAGSVAVRILSCCRRRRHPGVVVLHVQHECGPILAASASITLPEGHADVGTDVPWSVAGQARSLSARRSGYLGGVHLNEAFPGREPVTASGLLLRCGSRVAAGTAPRFSRLRSHQTVAGCSTTRFSSAVAADSAHAVARSVSGSDRSAGRAATRVTLPPVATSLQLLRQYGGERSRACSVCLTRDCRDAKVRARPQLLGTIGSWIWRDTDPTLRGPISKERRYREGMLQIISTLLARFRREDEEGQTLVEYGLLLALIAIIVIVALLFLGPLVSQIFQNVGENLQTA
jgi:pilus assembly protein Flp/PilA